MKTYLRETMILARSSPAAQNEVGAVVAVIVRLCSSGKKSFRNMCILSRHRIGDGFVEGFNAVPLVCRPYAAVAPDLVDTPVNFQRIIVRIAKFHRDLASGAPSALEVDLGASSTQAIARVQHFRQSGDFESKMMQFPVGVFPVAGAHQR